MPLGGPLMDPAGGPADDPAEPSGGMRLLRLWLGRLSAAADRISRLNPRTMMLLAGLITGLSFPPLPAGFLAWVGLTPLIQAWLGSSSRRQSAIYAFWWAMGYLTVVIYWIALNSGATWWAGLASMVAAVLALSLNYVVIGWWFAWLHQRLGRLAIWALPFVWVSVEFIRSVGVLSFPWVSLANSQAGYLYLVQNAELTGIYGLSFWVVAVNVLLVEAWHLRSRADWTERWMPAAVMAAAFGFPWVSGFLLLPEAGEKSFRIAVVQPNVNAVEKWRTEIRHRHFAQLDSLTRTAAVDTPRVVFWPEAAAPAYLSRRGGRGYLQLVKDLSRDIGIPVLTGMPDYVRSPGGDVRYYNAAGLIDSLGIQETYYKIHLVPMGEYVPLARFIPALGRIQLGQGHFTPGDRYTIFQVDSIKFGVAICYETTLPAFTRQLVREGAMFLVGLVNDAWFGLSSGPYQHAAQFRYRAVETRRPVVRAANTGISLVYDGAGREVARVPLNREDVFSAEIGPSTEITFYTRYGDLFAWMAMAVALAATTYAASKPRFAARAAGGDVAAEGNA